VIHRHRRVITLQTKEGGLFAICSPTLGNGPFHIRLADAFPWDAVAEGKTAVWRDETLQLGALRIPLAACSPWNPSPDWDQHTASRTLVHALENVLNGAEVDAASEMDRQLITHLLNWERLEAHGRNLQPLVEGLKWEDAQLLRRAADYLLGRGGGLTPAGDDILLGVCIAIWLCRGARGGALCEAICGEANRRTTTLSAGFLKAAARGEVRQVWHELFQLQERDRIHLERHLGGMLSYGASSGASALAGFLLGIHLLERETWRFGEP